MKVTSVKALLCALFVLGCGGELSESGAMLDAEVPDDATTLTGREELVGGTRTSLRPAVGRFRGCTATLFAPRYVITAAHCLNFPDYTDTRVFTTDRFSFRDSGGAERAYAVDRIHSFATARYEYASGSGMTTDVAIVRLTSAVPSTQATPAALSSVLPAASARATIFGFGCTQREPTSGGGFKQYLSFNYGSSTQALCPGDSGGPVVFGEASGAGALWGVNSDYAGAGSFSTWNDIFGDVPYLKYQIELLMQAWEGGRFVAGINRAGIDYRSIDLPTADPVLCETHCRNDGRCRSFSYVNPGVQGPSAKCWLKGVVPGAASSSVMVSGVRRGREVSVDRAGQDYRSFVPATADAGHCESACAREAACKAYSYTAPGVAGSTAACFLKKAVPNGVVRTSVTSGVKRGLELNTNRNGSDYRSFDLLRPEPEQCQATCASESACRAFTYVRPGLQGPNAKCWLKSTVPAASPSASGVISGVKGADFF